MKRDVGEGWKWDIDSSPADISPLLAATAALRAVELMPDPTEEPVRVAMVIGG